MIYVFIELYKFNGVCIDNFILEYFEVVILILWSILNINRKQFKGFLKIGLGLFVVCGYDIFLVKSVFKQIFVVLIILLIFYMKFIIGVVGVIINFVVLLIYDVRKLLFMDFLMVSIFLQI